MRYTDTFKIISGIALLFSLLTVWAVLAGNTDTTLWLWVSWVLALAAGIMSAVHAGRLRRRGWAAGLALVTVFIGGSAAAAAVDILAHPDGYFSSPIEANAIPVIVVFGEMLPPLVALLSAFLLRSGRQQRAAAFPSSPA